MSALAVCSAMPSYSFLHRQELLPLFLLILSPYLEASGFNTEWLVLAPNVFCSLV